MKTGPSARTRALSDYLGLKAATRKLVESAGGQESAATVTRLPYQSLGRHGRVQDPSFMPIDVVLDIESDTGDPAITRTLAHLQGYVLVAKPAPGLFRNWGQEVGALTKETGEDLIALSSAIGDGDVSPDEARTIIREVRETQEILARIEAAARDVVDRASTGRDDDHD